MLKPLLVMQERIKKEERKIPRKLPRRSDQRLLDTIKFSKIYIYIIIWNIIVWSQFIYTLKNDFFSVLYIKMKSVVALAVMLCLISSVMAKSNHKSDEVDESRSAFK